MTSSGFFFNIPYMSCLCDPKVQREEYNEKIPMID